MIVTRGYCSLYIRGFSKRKNIFFFFGKNSNGDLYSIIQVAVKYPALHNLLILLLLEKWEYL